jgi:large subunit ribosomal protein L5
MIARLQKDYNDKVVPALKQKLGRDNALAIPRLLKIVVSMGVGQATQDRKRLDEAVEHLGQITGQLPQRTRARKAVSAFRLRENVEIGCRVTLRGILMFEFLDRLITLALPRVRDFRGINPDGFDGHGNYSMGLNEQLVFPEISADKVTHVQGMNITFVTSANTNEDGRALLAEMGLPFRTEAATR